jgi:adenylate cyclase
MTELGESISASSGGMEVRHYSDRPFRSREGGGPRDGFEREALEQLRRFPERPYFAFVDDYRGGPALRYATARRMNESCVSCHNAHPESPYREWRVGDVRGVLEIIRPLEGDVAEVRHLLRGTFALLGTTFVALLLLTGLFVVASGRLGRRKSPGVTLRR